MPKIATFNILSSSYCNKETYPEYPPEALDNNKRWSKIKEILKDMMTQEYIICLQEVSEWYRSKLEVLVKSKGYSVIATNYDHFYSGNMGVATLYPESLKLKDCRFIRPANLVKKHIKEDFEIKNLDGFWGFLGYKEARVAEWYSKMSYKNNILLILSFIDEKQETYSVANYHAPCVYKCQKSMITVTACVLKALESISGKVFLAGDFNIKPDSLAYQILTTGSMLEKLKPDSEPDTATWIRVQNSLYMDMGLIPLKENIETLNLQGLKDAYIKSNTKLSLTTIKTKTHMYGETNEFEGCLDYIFYRDDPLSEIKPEESQVFPKDWNGELLPSLGWPSDHRMVAITFS